MSVLLITEAVVHILPARTHLEALPVPVLEDIITWVNVAYDVTAIFYVYRMCVQQKAQLPR